MTAAEVVPLSAQIACVDRELGMRKRVYPRWVRDGKLTKDAADLEMRRMEAVRETLAQLHRARSAGEADFVPAGANCSAAQVRADERAKVLGAVAQSVHTDVFLRIERRLDVL